MLIADNASEVYLTHPPNRTPCASTKDRFYCIEVETVAECLVALTPREVCKVHTDACAMEDVLDRGDVGGPLQVLPRVLPR